MSKIKLKNLTKLNKEDKSLYLTSMGFSSDLGGLIVDPIGRIAQSVSGKEINIKDLIIVLRRGSEYFLFTQDNDDMIFFKDFMDNLPKND